MDKNNRVHLNGLGDFDLKSVTKVEDPCPIELKKTVKKKQQEHQEEMNGKIKRKRTLKDRERSLYAPFSNIGAMNFENTTGYITIPDKYVVYTKLNEQENIMGADPSNGNEG